MLFNEVGDIECRSPLFTIEPSWRPSRPMGGKTVSQIAGAANLSTARAEAALHRLAEAGDVRQAANGLWYPS